MKRAVASVTDDVAHLLIRLLIGAFPAAEIAGPAATLGIPLDRRLRAFRIRPLEAGGPSTLLGDLRRRASHHWLSLAMMGGDIVGITTGVPCVGVSKAVVGVGSQVLVTGVPASFTQASRACDAAWSSRRVGMVRLDDVALDAAVVADPDVGDALERRYLAGLDTSGLAAGLLQETVLVLITHNLNVRTAAAALGLHPNSLRYRIRQFERATGADLTNLPDVFGVWWALQRRRRSAAGPRVHTMENLVE
jgi:hypothetical protein